MYDNRREGWILGGKYLAANTNLKKLGDKPTKAMVKEAQENNKPLNMAMFASKYTDNTQGKVVCGWSPKAFVVQKDILAKVRDAHGNHWDRIKKLEQDFLPILQQQESIQVEKATKKRRLDPLAALVVNEFSDDEDDFAD